MMTDPLADMLTRIRNAFMAKKPEVNLPHSNLKLAVAKILESEKFITSVERVPVNMSRRKGKATQYQLRLHLRYHEGVPAIAKINRVSRPGRRVYCKYQEMPRVQNDYGILIVSTPKGIMTSVRAVEEKVGGEILCELW